MTSNETATNPSRLHMLLVEIDSAASMMAIATISGDSETVRRCRDHALQTYLTGMNLILDTQVSDQEEQEVSDRLTPIRHWLEAAGVLNS